MRLACGLVIASALLTSCARRPGVYVGGGATTHCIARIGTACQASRCIGVRVFDAAGSPVMDAVVAAWHPDETFEEGGSPQPLWTSRTGSQGETVVYLHDVVIPHDGVLLTVDGRSLGLDVAATDGPVFALPECIDFVLPPVSQE